MWATGARTATARWLPDFDLVVDDLHRLVILARDAHPALPVVMVAHSMGGMIGTRYAERFPAELRGLVLSAPLIGTNAAGALLALDEIPELPIDVEVLSRDEAVQTAYAEDPLVYHGAFKRPTLSAMANALLEIALDADRVTGPVLWQHGIEDQLVPLEDTRRGVRLLRNAARRGAPLPRRPPRDLQRDQPGRGAGRHGGVRGAGYGAVGVAAPDARPAAAAELDPGVGLGDDTRTGWLRTAATTARSNLRPGAAAQLGQRLLVGPRSSVGPVRAHRVERVRHGEDPRRQRDVVPRQAVRIALSVDPFVAPTHELRRALQRRRGGDDPLADDGVLADELPLVGGQVVRASG